MGGGKTIDLKRLKGHQLITVCGPCIVPDLKKKLKKKHKQKWHEPLEIWILKSDGIKN